MAARSFGPASASSTGRRPGSGVSVVTDRARYASEQLILCAGPWLPGLFPEGRDLFAVHRQLQYWFPIRQGYEQLRNMPVFVWDFGGERGGFVHFDGFYGFPAVDGPAGGLKVATETYETTTEPDGRQHPPTPAETAAMYRHCIEARTAVARPGPRADPFVPLHMHAREPVRRSTATPSTRRS